MMERNEIIYFLGDCFLGLILISAMIFLIAGMIIGLKITYDEFFKGK